MKTIYTPKIIDNDFFQAIFLFILTIFWIVNRKLLYANMISTEISTSFLIIILLFSRIYIHEYSHDFPARFFFKIKTKVLIKDKICIPLEKLNPFQFIVMVLFPHFVQLIIFISLFVFLNDAHFLLSLLLLSYFVGGLGDFVLFFQAVPLLNKKVYLKFEESGVFSVHNY